MDSSFETDESDIEVNIFKRTFFETLIVCFQDIPAHSLKKGSKKDSKGTKKGGTRKGSKPHVEVEYEVETQTQATVSTS